MAIITNHTLAAQPAVTTRTGHDLIVVGASAGGIPAISTLLRGLPADLPAAILVVFHLAPDSGAMLPRMIGEKSRLSVTLAEDRAPLRHGEVRIAVSDHHLLVEPGMMRLVRGPRENRFRPAIDPLFRSAAWAYGPRVIGILLSGLLNDGSAGLWAIKSCGGVAVVQDPVDAHYRDMPEHALETLPVDHCVPVAEMSTLVTALARQPAAGNVDPVPSKQLEIETKMAEQSDEVGIDRMNRIGKLSPFTCPACHGSLWEVFDDYVLRFRCHTRHAFSAESLDAERGEESEGALFMALRSLEENARLARSVADRSRQRAHDRVARIYDDKASEADRSAEVIRHMLRHARGASKGRH